MNSAVKSGNAELKPAFLMWRLRLAYFLGADQRRLAQRYVPTEHSSRLDFDPGEGADPGLRQGPAHSCNWSACRSSAAGEIEPDATHDTFLKMVPRMKITLRPQPKGDLGTRMLAAVAISAGPILVMGTDCPALTEAHLRSAAMALRDGNDVVLIPAERGGYVLLGMRKAQPALFSNIAWGGSSVLTDTRARIVEQRLMLVERPPLWDVDTEVDLARLEREFPELKL